MLPNFEQHSGEPDQPHPARIANQGDGSRVTSPPPQELTNVTQVQPEGHHASVHCRSDK
jgi:hypothetical protein